MYVEGNGLAECWVAKMSINPQVKARVCKDLLCNWSLVIESGLYERGVINPSELYRSSLLSKFRMI